MQRPCCIPSIKTSFSKKSGPNNTTSLEIGLDVSCSLLLEFSSKNLSQKVNRSKKCNWECLSKNATCFCNTVKESQARPEAGPESSILAPHNSLSTTTSTDQVQGKTSIFSKLKSYGAQASKESSAKELDPALELNEWLRKPTHFVEEETLLDYWVEQSSEFPTLSSSALFLHKVPCSSIPSERLFSVSGRIVSDPRKARLSAEKLDMMCVINNNIDMLWMDYSLSTEINLYPTQEFAKRWKML